MTIALEFKRDMNEWAILVPKTLTAIERWGSVQGNQEIDQFGPHYTVRIRPGVKAPTGRKALWVLRPATLRLGAWKALQEAGSHWRGWERETSNVFYQVARPNPLTVDSFDERELDFMVQLAWFREVWFA